MGHFLYKKGSWLMVQGQSVWWLFLIFLCLFWSLMVLLVRNVRFAISIWLLFRFKKYVSAV